MTGNLANITKDLRSKFDADSKETQARKDADKRLVKKEEIFAITRLQERSKSQEVDNDIEVLHRSTLNINFSFIDP